MAKSNKSGGFRLDLAEPLADKLADFCAAHYDASKTSIIGHALETFIDQRLADPGEIAMRARYEEARRKRAGGE